MFLTVFALPVIGGIFLSRWHPYLLAAVGVCVVAAVAMIQVPELRWYVGGILHGDNWLTALLGRSGHGLPAPLLPDFMRRQLHDRAAGGVRNSAVCVRRGLGVHRHDFRAIELERSPARTEAEVGHKIWADLIEQLPLPALLVDPYTMRIGACSALASRYYEREKICPSRDAVCSMRCARLIRISSTSSSDRMPRRRPPSSGFPINSGSRTCASAYGPQGAPPRASDHRGSDQEFCLRTALEASEYAALVIDGQDRRSGLQQARGRTVRRTRGGVRRGAAAGAIRRGVALVGSRHSGPAQNACANRAAHLSDHEFRNRADGGGGADILGRTAAGGACRRSQRP